MMADLNAPNSAASASFAERLRGFGPVGLVALLIVLVGIALTPPIGAVLVLLWAWLSKTPLRELGYVRPKSWPVVIIIGILFGVAFKILMKAVVMPLLGAPAINPAFHALAHNNREAIEFAAYAVIGAGWGEETVFRGYFFERLRKWLGTSILDTVGIVLATALVFGAAHFQQGLPGMEQAAIVGLVFGTIFAATGRLFMLMVAHAAFDLTAATIIYFDLEPQFAHLIFK